MNNIKTTSTAELINILCETQDQDIINRIAYELTCRIWVPNKSDETFEEMLEKFGYKQINNKINKVVK